MKILVLLPVVLNQELNDINQLAVYDIATFFQCMLHVTKKVVVDVRKTLKVEVVVLLSDLRVRRIQILLHSNSELEPAVRMAEKSALLGLRYCLPCAAGRLLLSQAMKINRRRRGTSWSTLSNQFGQIKIALP